MTDATTDMLMATRALRAARGLLDAAEVLGTLDLSSLARLLSPLGLIQQPEDQRALHAGLGLSEDARPDHLAHLPWPGPVHLNGTTLLAHGRDALFNAALRMAAGVPLGRSPPTVRFTGAPSPSADEPLLQLLASWEDGNSPVLLVVGPPALTVDLLSPAPRDLQPVLRVLAEREGLPQPSPSSDVTYQLMPLLLAREGRIRDERITNDARAGVYSTAGGALVDLQLVDPAAADERVAGAIKPDGGVVLCCEPELVTRVLGQVGARVKAVLALIPSEPTGSVQVELPGRLVDATTGHVLDGLLADASVQSKDVVVDGGVVAGETAVAAPCRLLAGAARRATAEGKAAVMEQAGMDAVGALVRARSDGVLNARARTSVAVFRAERPAAARTVISAFLAQNTGPARSASGGKKVMIRG